MAGEKDLQKLLTSMEPYLHAEEYVFCSVSPAEFERLKVQPVGWFREAEGVTLILERGMAEQADVPYIFVCRMITLKVHSSLEAVGFLAAVARKLAEAGISVNPVAGYYHDHLFVPAEKATLAMQLLATFAQSPN